MTWDNIDRSKPADVMLRELEEKLKAKEVQCTMCGQYWLKLNSNGKCDECNNKQKIDWSMK